MTFRVVPNNVIRRLAAVVALVTLSYSASAQVGGEAGDSLYLIQPGDLLEISVWREEYLEREVSVQPDGRISRYPVFDLR